MKSLLILGFLATTNVFASTFSPLQNLSNTKLESLRVEILKTELITHNDLKKVITLKGKGATAQKLRERTVAQAIHTLCRFFDDGVALGINTKDEAGSLAAVNDFTTSMSMGQGDVEYDRLVAAIKAINAEPGVELYSGDASGNNTGATVLGFYDTKTNEVAVFANTNCGSDD